MRRPVLRKLLPILALMACAESSDQPPPRPALKYAQVIEYWCAARNQSSAPSYLWINAVDDKSGRRWSLVVESTDIPDAKSWDPNKDFPSTTFGEIVVPGYSYKDVVKARADLERFADSEIQAKLDRRSSGGELRESEPSEAFVHALFERGFFPSRNDYVPSVYVAPAPCEDADQKTSMLVELMKECISERDADCSTK